MSIQSRNGCFEKVWWPEVIVHQQSPIGSLSEADPFVDVPELSQVLTVSMVDHTRIAGAVLFDYIARVIR